jgi:hypothetical protein
MDFRLATTYIQFSIPTPAKVNCVDKVSTKVWKIGSLTGCP